jgi:hypothetical protein
MPSEHHHPVANLAGLEKDGMLVGLNRSGRTAKGYGFTPTAVLARPDAGRMIPPER